jgi:hypothetical protein
MEANEISEFSEQMKEAGESSMKHVSLIISVLAVLVAMVTVLGHREHTEAVLQQARATDQWNLYQARRIRSELVSGNVDLLSLQPNSNGAAVEKKLNDYKSRLDKWKSETDEDAEHAKEHEAEVDVAEAKAGRFDLGEALLQISVVLASITLLTRRNLYVTAALVLGTAGLLIAASAFLLH